MFIYVHYEAQRSIGSHYFLHRQNTEPHLEMQGKKLKGEGILVNDKREKTAKGLRSFVIQWFNLKSPATLTRVSVPITSYLGHNKIVSL